jgi:hypothetical protein
LYPVLRKQFTVLETMWKAEFAVIKNDCLGTIFDKIIVKFDCLGIFSEKGCLFSFVLIFIFALE